jgi:hypothetical protein
VCIRDLTCDTIQLAYGGRLADLRVLTARRADSRTNPGYGAWPHSGVWARLGKWQPRNGLVTPEPRKRPRSSYIRFAAELPNERWQSDFIHWQLADGQEVEVVSWIDDHSRLASASPRTR